MNLINRNELFLLEEIVKRNFASKYKGSVLGILWSVLRPLLIMIVLTVVFSTLFDKSIDNYPVYLLCGRCIYDFFTGSVGVAMNSISGNRNILQKTAAPKHIFILGSVLSEFINFIITVIILLGVMLVTRAPFYLSIMPLAVIPVISALILFTGVGFMLAIMRVYYTDIQHLWGVLTMMLMYASAIFYPMSIIPEPYHNILILNPIYWIIDQFRCLMYQGTIPSLHYIANSLLLSTIVLVIGIIIYKKYEKRVTMKF